MFMNEDPLRTRMLAPQPPPPPEIEGYLKKLKRKTSNLTGGWNKRWFFVDPKRLEFGYAKSKAPNAPRSSIYLNDITAVLQFDDTHFQVESRTRNFFLCGESKASTTCWVKSLDEYRRKLIEYEKELVKRAASVPTPSSIGLTADARSSVAASNQARQSAEKKKKTGANDNPARDSQQDSSTVSVSSSSNLAEEKLPRHITVEDVALSDEHRSSSPVGPPRRRESKSRAPSTAAAASRVRERERDVGLEESDGERDRERQRSGRGGRDRDRERGSERERERERGRDRVRDRDSRERVRGRDEEEEEHSSRRDRSSSANRRGGSKTSSSSGSSSRTNSGRGARSGNGGSTAGYSGHPTHGYVMQAWMDEYD